MRRMLLTLALVAGVAPLAAQDTRFTKEMRPGDRLELQNINGEIRVTQGTGRTAEIVVTKEVKAGDGSLVKAIMEEGTGYVRVCTVYLNRDPNRSTCRGENSGNWSSAGRVRFEVNMHYEVRAPAGVRLEVESVNGNVVLRGIDTPATVETVNGAIDLDGVGAHRLETVNGRITGRFTSSSWSGDLDLETVNGSIELSLPGDFSAQIAGETVNGSIDFGEFPVTMRGKWGPKTFTGTIGEGGRRIRIETVNGSVTLRRR
ncbi:MAG TPA: DUF4097 family beta strand repeat-containing protein [Gemmatimonadales bacterium]|nr:DUF4097 family beta strand repeat-containing protein [Gemmatimonadales bacterium]